MAEIPITLEQAQEEFRLNIQKMGFAKAKEWFCAWYLNRWDFATKNEKENLVRESMERVRQQIIKEWTPKIEQEFSKPSHPSLPELWAFEEKGNNKDG